jgi:cytochrome c-type biogenesis protein CcmH/NrfF
MTIRAGAVAAALMALVALATPAAAQEASLTDIEDEVMCPICGTTLELSDSPQAEREREFIRVRIEQGQSKDEIKDALVAEYGEDVLAVPGSEGFDLTAWVVPALGIGLAAIGVGLAIARLARRRDRDDGAPALEPEQDARIDRDMKSYDL